MGFLLKRKLATRIGIITTAITLAGMLLLWLIVSSRVASIVKSDIENQMTDAVEARAAIINDYVTSAEEYMTAFALGSQYAAVGDDYAGGVGNQGNFLGGAGQLRRRGEERGGFQGAVPAGADLEWFD